MEAKNKLAGRDIIKTCHLFENFFAHSALQSYYFSCLCCAATTYLTASSRMYLYLYKSSALRLQNNYDLKVNNNEKQLNNNKAWRMGIS